MKVIRYFGINIVKYVQELCRNSFNFIRDILKDKHNGEIHCVNF